MGPMATTRIAANMTKPTRVVGPITPMDSTTRGDEMNVDQGAVVTGILAVIGGIFWFARLEGRITTAEQRHADLKEDVSYIRERIDDALHR